MKLTTAFGRGWRRAAITACAGTATFCLSPAYAQEAQPEAEKLEEVVVSGFRQSIEKSLETKRESINFTDSISAEDVGKLPDNNLAEAIARIPGVQISRTNGEGQQINLRGLGPDFARRARWHADLGLVRRQRRPGGTQPRVRFRPAAVRSVLLARSGQVAARKLDMKLQPRQSMFLESNPIPVKWAVAASA